MSFVEDSYELSKSLADKGVAMPQLKITTGVVLKNQSAFLRNVVKSTVVPK